MLLSGIAHLVTTCCCLHDLATAQVACLFLCLGSGHGCASSCFVTAYCYTVTAETALHDWGLQSSAASNVHAARLLDCLMFRVVGAVCNPRLYCFCYAGPVDCFIPEAGLFAACFGVLRWGNFGLLASDPYREVACSACVMQVCPLWDFCAYAAYVVLRQQSAGTPSSLNSRYVAVYWPCLTEGRPCQRTAGVGLAVLWGLHFLLVLSSSSLVAAWPGPLPPPGARQH